MPSSTPGPATSSSRRRPPRRSRSLAKALQEDLQGRQSDQLIGTRHGEKLYETLLTREEMAKAEDLGGYYRIPAERADLNYNLYFTEGAGEGLANGWITTRTTPGGSESKSMVEMLQGLDIVRQELVEWLTLKSDPRDRRQRVYRPGTHSWPWPGSLRSKRSPTISIRPEAQLGQALDAGDVVFHLAGVEPSRTRRGICSGNTDFAGHALEGLERRRRRPLIVLSSSTQASSINPYGRSEAHGRGALFDIARRTGAPASPSASLESSGNGAGRTTIPLSPRSATISSGTFPSSFRTRPGDRAGLMLTTWPRRLSASSMQSVKEPRFRRSPPHTGLGWVISRNGSGIPKEPRGPPRRGPVRSVPAEALRDLHVVFAARPLGL